MKKLLFVCSGNTCRSCMAEAIFNNINQNDNFKASSAGIYVVKNSKTSPNSAKVVMSKLNIDISTREAVQLTALAVEESYMIFTMTKGLKEILINNYPQFKSKIYSLNEYTNLKGDVADPYGGEIEVYSKTYEDLIKSITILIDKLKEDNFVQ